MNSLQVTNGLSVDVEDWFQVGAFEDVIEKDSWDSLGGRVERNCDAILQMFADADVKATFFALGWVAQRNPALMRRIVEEGHELASHGWDHARVFRMDRTSFARDIEMSRKALEDAAGVAIVDDRADERHVLSSSAQLLDRSPHALGLYCAGRTGLRLQLQRRPDCA